MVGNLFWGNHLDYFCIKPRSMDAQVLFRSFHTKIIQSTTAITSIVIRCTNRLQISTNLKNNLSLRGESMDSPKQSKQNNLHEVQTESRPIRGAKNRIQTSSSASADFLLESDKRGSPPKSEKRQLLGTQFKRIGGSGAVGAALLQKDSSDKNSVDLKADLSAKSHKKIDSKFALDSRDLDSSRCRAQNDEMSADCFGDELPRNDDRVDCYEIPRHTERSEVSKSCDFNQTKDAMTQNSESYRFAQSKQVTNDSQVAKMDSSRCRAQNDDRVDCHDFAMQNLAMTERIIDCNENSADFFTMTSVDSSLRGSVSEANITKQSTNQKIDCFGQSPRNDGIVADCFDSAIAESRNDSIYLQINRESTTFKANLI